jgi:uncharacterized cupin superfamily protein
MSTVTATERGEGWTVGSVDGLGEAPGFRKIRSELGVTAFGVNAVVLPPGYESGLHFHERQEELYIVLAGEIEFRLGEDRRTLGAGGLVRVDPSTVRGYRNASEIDDAIYICVGGAGGYVGRDGKLPEGETRR